MANASYAITASFGSISTDPNSRTCISKEAGIAKAMANLQYIMRHQAVNPLLGGALLYRTNGLTHHVPLNVEERSAFIEMCEKKLNHRARKHTKFRGVRLLDIAIVSLPADANCHQRIEIAQLAGDSDATVVAAIHTDRQGNPHLHLWMIDGLETTEQALARTQARTEHTHNHQDRTNQTRPSSPRSGAFVEEILSGLVSWDRAQKLGWMLLQSSISLPIGTDCDTQRPVR